MSEYRPHIHVERDSDVRPVLAAVRSLSNQDVLVAPVLFRNPDLAGDWELSFIAVDYRMNAVVFPGSWSETDAVAAAQEYVMQHGRLQVVVQIQPSGAGHVVETDA